MTNVGKNKKSCVYLGTLLRALSLLTNESHEVRQGVMSILRVLHRTVLV